MSKTSDTALVATSFGAFDAKTHLSQLLDRVEKGERITITKHGRPVACLVPVDEQLRRTLPAQVKDFLAKTETATLGPELTMQQLIAEGRTR
jgi:prevent-host-death family protein